jgi:hypothetical protein
LIVRFAVINKNAGALERLPQFRSRLSAPWMPPMLTTPRENNLGPRRGWRPRRRISPLHGAVPVLAISAADSYLRRMLRAFEFCLPIKATSVPSGPDWLHEVKHDGYRIRLERDGDCVRLITRGGLCGPQGQNCPHV